MEGGKLRTSETRETHKLLRNMQSTVLGATVLGILVKQQFPFHFVQKNTNLYKSSRTNKTIELTTNRRHSSALQRTILTKISNERYNGEYSVVRLVSRSLTLFRKNINETTGEAYIASTALVSSITFIEADPDRGDKATTMEIPRHIGAHVDSLTSSTVLFAVSFDTIMELSKSNERWSARCASHRWFQRVYAVTASNVVPEYGGRFTPTNSCVRCGKEKRKISKKYYRRIVSYFSYFSSFV